jgi:hypothetical protein
VSLIAFGEEEQVEAFGEVWTLRLDFHPITVIEGATSMQMPDVVAHIRSGKPAYSLLAQVLWALLREHHSKTTLNECLAIVMDKGPDGAKFGFALNALLERTFPVETEDRKKPNPPKQRGRSKSSVASG